MSKTTKSDSSAGAAQADALVSQTEQPTPAANEPVVKAEKYVFGDYQDGQEFKGKLHIGDLFRPGFDPTPYQFTWIRFNRLEQAQSRYYTKVTKMTHGQWFNDKAFHPVHGAITRGEEFTDGKTPEVYLHVRPAEAARAETEQMLKMSAKNRNPHTSEVQGVVDGIGKAIGTNYLRGGLTQTVKSGWE